MPELSKAETARKSRYSLSPLGTGLTAKTICLANESRDAFQRLAHALTGQWEPVNESEDELLEEMVVAKWLQRRYWGIHTATIDLEMAVQAPEFAKKYEEAGEMVRQAEALQGIQAKSNTMTLLNRYDASFNRQYHRAMNQLIKIREKNVFPTPQNDPPSAQPTNDQRRTNNDERPSPTTQKLINEKSTNEPEQTSTPRPNPPIKGPAEVR